MKITSLVSLVALGCSAIALAEDPAARQLQVYPKNLARQHLGSNLFLFNPTTQTYVPTEAAAAWLDDDVSTGWPMMAGKQHYLLALSEPELLTNFALSARPANGTVTLYAGDDAAAPSANSWTVIAKDLSHDAINEKKLAKPFSRFAKYLLIETDVANPGPVFSLYLYGEKPAVSYSLRKREQPIDARAVFGPYINNQTNFNVAGLYSMGRVTYANAPDGYLSWQKIIDDNPESGITVAGSTSDSGVVIKYGEAHSISRVSVLTQAGAKGKLDFFAVKAPAEGLTTVSNGAAAAPHSTVGLDGLTPTVSIVLDGSTTRSSLEFPPVEASQLLVRWSPVVPAEQVTLRELSTSNGYSLNDYEVALNPEVVAEYRSGYDPSKDGKDFKDPKSPEDIALGPNSPYLPGALGFPPILTGRRIPPPSPLSP